MARINQYGEEEWHLEYSRKLFQSEKISPEDKVWVDKIFTKSTLKLSEEERLRRLYKEIFGKEENPSQEI